MPSQDLRGKCRKKNPATCRLHGKAYRQRIAFMNQIREREEELKFQAIVTPDFEASWDVRKEADGTTTVAVYRSGEPLAPTERGVEKDSYVKSDSLKPEGRQGRTDGVFASPTLGGVTRWVRGKWHSNVLDVQVREIRVDIDSTYVYSIHAWEKASSGDDNDAFHKEYWDSGITMREYMKRAKQEPKKYSPREWELLLSAEKDIRSASIVEPKKVGQRAYEQNGSQELENMLNDKPLNYNYR
jgi:hypothetical protein